MSKIKGVILSVEDTLLPEGKVDRKIFEEVDKLIRYFRSKKIEFVVFTNRAWVYGNEKVPLENVLRDRWGDFTYLCRAKDRTIPGKPTRDATQYVLDLMGWESTQTLYIGASENDMQTAVNGNLLFLRAIWWANKTDYGFEFSSPKDIARFIDTFCLREHLWCHEIHDGDFNFYALAPFSTMKEEYTLYSADARDAAKHGTGHPDFWVGALVSSLYFSGVHEKINYVAVYPGHKAGHGNVVMDEAISIFGKCFRKNYIKDLIVRHKESIKSQTARNKNISIDHLNQLNTIHINQYPLRNEKTRYKNSPLNRGKTVLLIDDITTRGYSFESARAYIEQTGAKVILVSWLKTINTDISMLKPYEPFNPYVQNIFTNAEVAKVHSYKENIVDSLAPAELTKMFRSYKNWDWPA
ncbi:TPA: phosphoribosyl transferase [Serratia marcescens]|uniref:phosphoribosyl transferase n=1 Tax=Serratia marcescens TaxID=615 RepID=UPI0018742CF7|nr:phosphoribosyl transferase [Serratia marcescens]MBE5258876.1 phosphoribosyl transferase [Serratia marcescens]MBE5300040.1 phosphoribosyl transferase [Serratia marcescens]MBE5304700.1 phosphoribosyl transferase [Serratia marcescens]HEJ0402943.1 phosphoribosyl transferase [Serratia marcescens]HEJ7311682.1 phosphoribosyl transferase [Serratia marcescens]